MALPMPLAPPVTTAVLPARSYVLGMCPPDLRWNGACQPDNRIGGKQSLDLGGIELAVGLVCELRIPKYCPGLQRQLPQIEHPFARPSRFVRANDGGMRRNQSSDARRAQS